MVAHKTCNKNKVVPKTLFIAKMTFFWKNLSKIILTETENAVREKRYRQLWPFNMLCILFILCVTCLVNKLLQYNTIQYRDRERKTDRHTVRWIKERNTVIN